MNRYTLFLKSHLDDVPDFEGSMESLKGEFIMYRSRLGSNQYRLRPKTTVQALLLSFPFAVSGYFIFLFIVFFLKSFRTLKYPAVWLVFLVSTFIPVSFANAPRSVLTHPFIPKAAPVPLTPEQIIYTYPHGDIIWRIYGLESSYGLYPLLYCKQKGLISDMGYNALNHQCFQTFKDEVATVNNWIDQHKDLAIGQLLCEYNTGTLQNCDYKYNFLNL